MVELQNLCRPEPSFSSLVFITSPDYLYALRFSSRRLSLACESNYPYVASPSTILAIRFNKGRQE